MIDSDGYRANVGIILCNDHGLLFWGRRIGQNSWQFPQGGIKPGETPEQAMYRELEEEVGLKPHQVRVLGQTENWLRYHLPRKLIRKNHHPICIGQKQRWFLLRVLCKEKSFRLDATQIPEFDDWRWVRYWYPLCEVVYFKRRVYSLALRELAPILLGNDVPNYHIPTLHLNNRCNRKLR